MKNLHSIEHNCPKCGVRLAFIPPHDFARDPAKLRAEARALWSVRVLDAWQKARVMHAEPFRCYAPFDLETDAPLNWLCVANADDGVSRRFLATTPDAARHAAAQAVYPTLSADIRAKLGECL